MKSKILVVDEYQNSLNPLQPMLDEEYIIFTCHTLSQAQSQLAGSKDFSLLILCFPNHTKNLEQFLSEFKTNASCKNVSILALVIEIDTSISLLQIGIHDFITLPELKELALNRIEQCVTISQLKQADSGIKNVMENIVLNLYDRIRNTLNCCSCPTCKSDIITYTLNNLPPKYVATHKGELLSKTSQLTPNSEIDVISALAKAAHVVNSNPRHHQ